MGACRRAEDYLHCRYQRDGTLGPGRLADVPARRARASGSGRSPITSGGRHPARAPPRSGGLATRYLSALWDQPSYDAWEESPQQVHTSTLGAILAGLQAAEALAGDRVADIVSGATAADRGSRLGMGAEPLTKWAGNPGVDASLLWIAVPYGLLT